MKTAQKSTIPCENSPQKLPNLIFSYCGQFVRPFTDLILPPRCVVTGEILAEKSGLSPKAWGELTFITDPSCAICADPFDFEQNGEEVSEKDAPVCANCLETPPHYARARAALVYDEASRPIVLGFKHGDKTYMAPFLAQLMAGAGQELIDESDLIVPVPLHWTRLLKRRYNQSALLARRLSRQSGKPYDLMCLKRLRATVSQGHLSAKERAKNVANVFQVPEKMKGRIQGKTILLIDDVLTSGATVEACTKALLKAGASKVNVLCLVRARNH